LLLSACLPATAASGSAACAGCHSKIYTSYMQTPMARSSGRMGTSGFQEKFDQAEFFHAPSGVRYRVHRDRNNTLFDFEFNNGEAPVRGSQRLEYFVGSGMVGRSYLISVDNFLYQSPVAYYSGPARWQLSPGYQDRDHLYLTRPAGVTCLQCHASRLQPAPGTQNGFADAPFLEGGIGCESCHGPGEEHIRTIGSDVNAGGSQIVNPRKLSPQRRESICAQCHLTGVVRIGEAGRDRSSFVPGSLLSDSLSVFVWRGAAAEMTVTSHFEKLAQSRCKIKAGDRLWCGSCHDPHSVLAESEKTRHFVSKCLECHSSADSCREPAAQRTQKGNNCLVCHMPKNPVTDVAHAVYTDHSIPRRAAMQRGRPASSPGILTLFGGGTASERDLGLAYAHLAEIQRNTAYERRAFELLKTAAGRNADDVPVLVQLAHLHGNRGETEQAARLYERAVRSDPGQVVAANNLAMYLMQGGDAERAIALWSRALASSPGFESVRINLAVAQSRTGDSRAAEETLRKGLELNPGSTALRRLLRQLRPAAP
jgi:Flp pilus assembly protein TadD